LPLLVGLELPLMLFRPACWFAVLLAAIAFAGAPAVRAADASGVPQDVQDAFKQLKTADATGREKIYDLLANNGDARIIPALKAYRQGELVFRNGQLCIYGASVNIPGQGQMIPLLDAFTGAPVLDSNGKPLLFAKEDLSNAIPSPPRRERISLLDLISQLALLDPDPQARLANIRAIGDKAGRGFIDAQDIAQLQTDLNACKTALSAVPPTTQAQAQQAISDALQAIDAALAEKPTTLTSPAPTADTTAKLISALTAVQAIYPAPVLPPGVSPPAGTPATTINNALLAANSYSGDLDGQQKTFDELDKFAPSLRRQLSNDPNGAFSGALRDTLAAIDLVRGDAQQQKQAVIALGHSGTSEALNLLQKTIVAANRMGDPSVVAAANDAISRASHYQDLVHAVLTTFYGLSDGSILVLLALGLSIIFGLMGVINMAHGEFMMIGAFTTFVVSEFFRQHLPVSWFDYYPIAAIPAAFIVAGAVGWLCEALIVRHMYGRPLDTLLATWGVSLMLIQAVRGIFGDNLHITPPAWMEGSIQVASDLSFARNRLFILLYCGLCIAMVYFLVNRTKLGLLLRATTQNRDMAAALGVATRRVDALTFSFGTALAGLAGVAVPMYDKINPGMGQDYVVESFLVVVVGGVGKLAGVIWSGLGIGFVTKYFEAALQWFPSTESGASTIGKVLVLACIVVFLQKRPAGLFPPRGRLADA
jgi:urea transport system permease protein